MSAITLLGIHSIKLPNPRLLIRVRRFNQQMIVIVHQAASMTNPMEFFYAACQQIRKQLLIFIIKIDRSQRITVRGEVINSSGEA